MEGIANGVQQELCVSIGMGRSMNLQQSVLVNRFFSRHLKYETRMTVDDSYVPGEAVSVATQTPL